MAIWPYINPTTPAATDKVKFGDDVIRSGKAATISALQVISNFRDNAGDVAALRTAVWTTAGRPTGDDLVDRVVGLNTDHGCIEYYDLASATWKYHSGQGTWTTTARPSSPPTGVIGFCTDLWVTERYSGSVWQRISGGQRGDIKEWSGAVADISTKNPGWVLANGSSQTIDGSTFTVPDLRDKFIVGAGSTYAVGSTGGEATHTLTVNETPSHDHNIGYSSNSTGNNGTGGLLIGWWNGWSDTNGGNYWMQASGGGQPHNNLPPFYAFCYLYKL